MNTTAPDRAEDFAAAARAMGDRNRSRMLRGETEGRTMVVQEQFERGPNGEHRRGFVMARISHLRHRLRRATEVGDRLRLKRARATSSAPVVAVASGARARSSHGSATRTRGSRRGASSRSSGGGSSGSDDPDGESEPPRLRLWRHPDLGPVSPALYRILLREGRS